MGNDEIGGRQQFVVSRRRDNPNIRHCRQLTRFNRGSTGHNRPHWQPAECFHDPCNDRGHDRIWAALFHEFENVVADCRSGSVHDVVPRLRRVQVLDRVSAARWARTFIRYGRSA
jgi:hypothetical protein